MSDTNVSSVNTCETYGASLFVGNLNDFLHYLECFLTSSLRSAGRAQATICERAFPRDSGYFPFRVMPFADLVVVSESRHGAMTWQDCENLVEFSCKEIKSKPEYHSQSWSDQSRIRQDLPVEQKYSGKASCLALCRR